MLLMRFKHLKARGLQRYLSDRILYRAVIFRRTRFHLLQETRIIRTIYL